MARRGTPISAAPQPPQPKQSWWTKDHPVLDFTEFVFSELGIILIGAAVLLLGVPLWLAGWPRPFLTAFVITIVGVIAVFVLLAEVLKDDHSNSPAQIPLQAPPVAGGPPGPVYFPQAPAPALWYPLAHWPWSQPARPPPAVCPRCTSPSLAYRYGQPSLALCQACGTATTF